MNAVSNRLLALQIAEQVIHDQHELDTSAWGGCVWEHTGDALRDFMPVARNLLDAEVEILRLRDALHQIAASVRPDGTYNLGREACESLAKKALDGTYGL